MLHDLLTSVISSMSFSTEVWSFCCKSNKHKIFCLCEWIISSSTNFLSQKKLYIFCGFIDFIWYMQINNSHWRIKFFFALVTFFGVFFLQIFELNLDWNSLDAYPLEAWWYFPDHITPCHFTRLFVTTNAQRVLTRNVGHLNSVTSVLEFEGAEWIRVHIFAIFLLFQLHSFK